jgi:transcriptional regulator with XRE-family HTH domain
MGRSQVGVALGARLRARRGAKALSQAKLAEMVGLTPNYLGSVERGDALPTVQTLIDLATAVGTTPAELLGDSGERDAWLEQLMAVGKTVPLSLRPFVLGVVRLAATAPGNPSTAPPTPPADEAGAHGQAESAQRRGKR